MGLPWSTNTLLFFMQVFDGSLWNRASQYPFGSASQPSISPPHALGTLVLALNGCSGQVLFDKDISAVLFQRIIGFDDIFFEFG